VASHSFPQKEFRVSQTGLVSRLTPLNLCGSEIDGSLLGEPLMGRTTKRVMKAAAVLAASALVEKAIDKVSAAARSKKARRKAASVGKAVRSGAKSTAKLASQKARKLRASAEKKVPVVRKKAARQLEKLARMTAP
jgi:hypothetical protein